MEEYEPLWRRVMFNEFVLAAAAALIILYVAFRFATSSAVKDDSGRPVPTRRS